ncbi:MAG: hypothetical protein HUU43_16895, partial [Ignavibacteriaceae bacterium]|nr:hypothetical protein [Ignavibacteriaceae bacterium]
MNRKAIKAILTAKFNDWVKSIDDENVQSLVRKNTIITGGSIASLLLKEKVKDYDIYFRNKETTLAVAHYYVKKFNELNGKKVNRLGHTNEAFVLDGEKVGMFKDGLLRLNDIAPGYENQGNAVSHMITNTPPDRVKIIVRSDGVAAEDDSILADNFEDVYDVISDADQIDEEKLEQADGEKGKYRPIFLSSNAITLSGKI